MVCVQDLKDKAGRYFRLARSITSQQDIDLFESLGAEAEQAATDMEVREAAQQKATPRTY
jgi:hypothetical protein